MNDFELGYCVGLLEGEGSFCVIRNHKLYNYTINCQMTDYEPLEKLLSSLGGHINGPYKKFIDNNTFQTKSYWNWQIGIRIEVLKICKLLYPHMSPRRKQQIELVVKTMLEHPERELFKHGTIGMYSNHGCRCNSCVEIENEYRKKLRIKNKNKN